MTPRRRRRTAVAVVAAAALAATASCTSSRPGRAGPPVTPSPSPSPTSTTPSAPTGTLPSTPKPPSPPKPPKPSPVTLAFAGDIHFEGALRRRLDDPATALPRSPAMAALAAADVAVVNLETSVGSGGSPEPGKRYTFQAPPAAFTALAEAGIDVATMANNHALDFGREALSSTFAAIDEASRAQPPLEVVGIGRDAAEAFQPAITDVDGTIIATLGATIADTDPTADPTGEWAATPERAGTADAVDPTRLLRAVARSDASADVIVVYVHGGIQGERCPSDLQRSLAADLVEAGADVVVGSHAHLLQGDGRLTADGAAYVAYGLGNFAWYTQTPATADTGVLSLTVQPPRSRAGRARVAEAGWTPALIGADGLPGPVSRSAAAEADVRRQELRACAGLMP